MAMTPSMKKRVGLGALSAAAALFFLLSSELDKRNPTAPAATVAATADPAVAAAGPALHEPTAPRPANPEGGAADSRDRRPGPARLDPETLRLVSDCLAKHPRRLVHDMAEAGKSLDTLREALFKNREARTEVDKILVHATLPDGRQRRLLVTGGDGKDGGKREARVFGVDAEGLPTMEPLPAAHADLATDEIVARFKSDGAVTYSETSATIRAEDGLSASVLEADGHVRELQVFFGRSSLGCGVDGADGRLACKCL